MLRSTFFAVLLSFLALAGCMYPGDSGSSGIGAPWPNSGSTTLRVDAATIGDTSRVHGHRVVVEHGGVVEADTIVPLNDPMRVIRYEASAHAPGTREVTLVPLSDGCELWSANPRTFEVAFDDHRTTTVDFAVRCTGGG